MIKNQFANYVVQKALKLAQGPDKDLLISCLSKVVPDITDKRIREKWERLIYDAINGTNTASQVSVADANSQGSNHDQQEGGQSHRQIIVKGDGRRANSSDNVTAAK